MAQFIAHLQVVLPLSKGIGQGGIRVILFMLLVLLGQIADHPVIGRKLPQKLDRFDWDLIRHEPLSLMLLYRRVMERYHIIDLFHPPAAFPGPVQPFLGDTKLFVQGAGSDLGNGVIIFL